MISLIDRSTVREEKLQRTGGFDARNPKLISLLFNEAMNNQDIDTLSDLMTEDHTFIDRELSSS